MTDTIQFSQRGAIGELLLNNPERHNSLGSEELDAISAIIERVKADSTVRVLVVTGAGEKTFCAGASLQQMNSGAISGDSFQAATDLLASLSIPTVCAINGNVYGGGVELALSCDFRIGIEGSRMRVPAAVIGLCYPVGGIARFVERLGLSVAKRVLMAAEEFDANGMVDIGFLDKCVAREDLNSTVCAYSEYLASLAPLAVAAMKTILQQLASGELDPQQAAALAQQCAQSSDLQEGFAAKREKRSANFRAK